MIASLRGRGLGCFLVAGVLGACSAGPAHAFLSDRGLYTHDTRTGLRWLDLTHTQGLSYNQVIAQMGSGGLFENHVYATETQVLDMFINAGLPVPTFQSPVTDPVKQRMLDLQALFGTTVTSNTGTFIRSTSNGISGTPVPGSPGSSVVPFVDVIDFVAAGQQDLGGAGTSSQSRNQGLSGSGSWLLRLNNGSGITQSNPTVPATTANGMSAFAAADGLGSWYDPAFAAPGYDYATTDGSKFVSVELPLGIADGDQVFTISDPVNGDATVAAGDLYVFAQTVSEFTIAGIGVDPLAPVGTGAPVPTAFPTYLTFDAETVGFTVNAVPEPASGLLVLAGLAGFVSRRRG